MTRLLLLLCCTFVAPLNPSFAQSRFDLQKVEWTISPAENAESVHFEMRLAPLHQRETVTVRMPRWKPGAYRYSNYERKLSELVATDQHGKEREILEIDPRTWEVECSDADELRISYRLRTSNEAAKSAPAAIHLHGPEAFMYTEDSLQLPHLLNVELPAKWDFASGHRPVAGKTLRFQSPNFDVFVDCPIAMGAEGALERHQFESHGVPFEVVIFGQPPNSSLLPRDEWLAKVQAICEATYTITGDYPFERYVFLYLFNGVGGYYGLEHLNSTTIAYNWRWAESGEYSGLESVTAHEFFHLWNVKRIRPFQLGPFDYSQDVRTKDLWWLEGVTSYYTDIILQRAGLRKDGWFLDAQEKNFIGQFNSSGYGIVSPERASRTEWDPQPGAQISYYDQGQTLGLFLDILIRQHTDNQRTLDDVVSFMHRWVNYPEQGYREGDLERAVRAITGWDCGQFFERHIRGVVDLPWENVMAFAGVDARFSPPGGPYLGFGADDDLVISVKEESGAYAAGLRAGDRLIRMAETKLTSLEQLKELVDMLPVAEEVEVVVRRNGSTKRFQLTIAERKRLLFKLEQSNTANERQKRLLNGVLKGIPQGS